MSRTPWATNFTTSATPMLTTTLLASSSSTSTPLRLSLSTTSSELTARLPLIVCAPQTTKTRPHLSTMVEKPFLFSMMRIFKSFWTQLLTTPGTPSKSTKRKKLLVQTLRKANKSDAESKHYVIKKLTITRTVPHDRAILPKS